MGRVWMTKYGARSVRHEPPTLEEALSAAQDLTSDPDQKLQIAASLLGLPLDQIAGEAERIIARRAKTPEVVVIGDGRKTVIVERKAARQWPRNSMPSQPSARRVGKSDARG